MNKFELGQVVCTSGIYSKIESDLQFKKFVEESLLKYINRDWGDTCKEDSEMNDEALINGDRILAVYISEETKDKIWIITVCDRSYTTILFPSEY